MCTSGINATQWSKRFASSNSDQLTRHGPYNLREDRRKSNEGKNMDTNSTMRLVSCEGSRQAGAEQRLKELGIKLPAPPEPFGTYVEAVQTGNLLFLTGMLPTEGRAAKFIGRVGAELDVEAGRQAAYLAALNGLAVAREHLGFLDKVTRIVRLGAPVELEIIFEVVR